jgi:hypothetical protein
VSHKKFSAAEPQSSLGISPAKAQRAQRKLNFRTWRSWRPFDLAQDVLGAMIVLFLDDLARIAMASQTPFLHSSEFHPFETFGTI